MALFFTSSSNTASPTARALSATSRTTAGLFSKAAASGISLSRAFVYEFEVGANGLPAAVDCAIEWDASLATTTGTTADTCIVNPLDPADVAASHDSFCNPATDGTTTANSQRWQLSANQRASYRWVVNPGGPGELVLTNVASNGIIWRAKSSTYTSTATTSLYFRE
jgi:hypothetical protein